MKIVVLDGYTLAADGNSWDALHALSEVKVHDRSSSDEVVERARPATLPITNNVCLPTAVIEGSPELRFIALSAAGDQARHSGVEHAGARHRLGRPIHAPLLAAPHS